MLNNSKRYTVAMKTEDGTAASANGNRYKFTASDGQEYVGALHEVLESHSTYPIYRLLFEDGSIYEIVKNLCTQVDNSVPLSRQAPPRFF